MTDDDRTPPVHLDPDDAAFHRAFLKVRGTVPPDFDLEFGTGGDEVEPPKRKGKE